MKPAIALAIVLTACVAPAADLPRDVACDEQALAWCQRAGYDTAGCHVWYRHECTVAALTPTVAATAQDACLDAIATTTTPSIEPDACRATWR